GTFGVVHRAYQPGIGREVAIKVIRPRFANNPDFIRRFESEAQTIARLEHPHIVPLYDYWREPDNAYWVMRWLRGGSLEQRLRRSPLPLEATIRLVDQVAAALQAAHRQHIIHRDVKAANILLDEDGNAYLSDFSVAKELINGGVPLDLSSSPETISPEQLMNEGLTLLTDQYSLGIVIYRMLTGRAPFPQDLPASKLRHAILTEPLPRLATQMPGFPQAVDDVLQRVTAKKPGDRFPDMVAMARAFQRAAATVGMTIAPQAETSAVETEAAMIDNPYKGLRAFQESDTATFFGRDALVARLVRRLDRSDGIDSRFLAVVGPSGSGKSSIVKAGLLPALRAGAAGDREVPDDQGVAGSENWFIVEMTPGRRPMQELETALLRVAVDPPASLLEPLEHDTRGLIRVLERILPLEVTAAGPPQLLLVIDQFEELFTLTEDDEARQHFIESLLAALAEHDSRIRVVVTLRADFYDRPLQIVGLGELLRQNTEVVLPLAPAELEETITRPAALAGVRLEPGLLTAITADVTDQPGTLPLMQYALTELFEQRTNATMTNKAYRAIGGVSGALGRRAGEIYKRLNAAGQVAARQIFLRLVTLGEGVEDTRRRALRAELEALEIPGADVGMIINTFGQYRLLSFDRDPATRGPTVEVAHEALLREWDELGGWLDECRADVRMQRLLASEAVAWQAAGQDDSYLLHGGRLEQFDGWVETSGISLTGQEQAYLSASLAARDQRRADEEARRRRELDTARQLAETEGQRAEEQTAAAALLRRRAALLAVALAVAGLLAVAAVLFARSSGQNAAIAATRAAESNANAALAVDNANLAGTRQAEAVIEANQRATAEAEANVQRDTALVSERAALESYSLSLAANARQALAADNQQLALLLALAANQIEDPPLEAWRTLLDVAYAPGAIRTFITGSPVNTVDLSPDGRTMLTGTEDGHIRLWDFATGEVLHDLRGHGDAVNAVAFSPDGRQALSGSRDKSIRLWDLSSGDLLQTLTGHMNEVSAVAFLPDGRYALSGEDSGSLPGEMIVWDLRTGEPIRRFGADLSGEIEGVQSIAISPDGRTVVAGLGRRIPTQDKNSIGLWDITTGELIEFLEGTELTVNNIRFSPDGNLVVAAADDGAVYTWELTTGQLRQRLDGHEGIASAVAISPDGTTALSGAMDGSMIWWDLRTGEIIDRFRDHSGGIGAIEFVDAAQAVSASADGTLRLWDLAGRWQLARWGESSDIGDCTVDLQWGFRKVSASAGSTEGSGSCITDLEISPDGRYALSAATLGTGDNNLTLWDYAEGRPVRTIAGIERPVVDIAFTPDSKHALTSLDNEFAVLWDLETGQEIGRLVGHNGAVNGVDISSDGRFALTASLDSHLIYWNLETGEMLRRMTGYVMARGSQDVKFLPGDRLAISSGWDGTMILWDLTTGEQIHRLTGLDGGKGGHLLDTDFDTIIFEMSISPNGRQVLSAGDDESLVLWDLATGQSLRRLTGHADNVSFVRHTPDGGRALSGARNDGLILWNVATGAPIRRFPVRKSRGGGFTPTVAIHPNGMTALTDDVDGTILQWQLSEPTTLEFFDWLATHRAIREFTCFERETYLIEPLCVSDLAEETTADMIATARENTKQIAPQSIPAGEVAEPFIMSLVSSVREPKIAVLGDNGGELTRKDFDVWEYQGRAGEVLAIKMIADQPLTDPTIPVDQRFDAGVLDTVLFVMRPNGTLLFRTDDDVAPDGTRLSDANILAVILPEDGTYRIEARSALDDHAGGYNLRIDPVAVIWDEELFAEYTGVYLDGPWEYHLYVFIQDGRIYDYIEEVGMIEEYTPVSETDFVLGDGIFQRFTRDENGVVNGYDVFISLIHPVGGRWYKGIKLGELPPDFYETVTNILSSGNEP
ncbi:MAG: protein kinase, partial [Chloroflexota bacterium]